MKRLLLILLLLWPSLAWGEILYVRPQDGGPYGDDDGTSYANAWDGLDHVVWGTDAGEVGEGDTLYVCGTHYYDSGGASYLKITVGASGSSGNEIVIRGDYAGDSICRIALRPRFEKITLCQHGCVLEISMNRESSHAGMLRA